MLSRNAERGYPCLGPAIRGNAFSHEPLKMVISVGFHIQLLFCWSFLLFLVWMFLSWKGVEFLSDSFSAQLRWSCGYSSFCWYGVLPFWSVELSFHVRNKSCLFRVYNPFNMLLTSVCCILLKVLTLVFRRNIGLQFPYRVLIQLWYQSNVGLSEWVWKYPLLFSLLETFENFWS